MDFFRIERGLELDEKVQYLQGTGAPGASGDTAAAEIGSVYTDNATGDLYTKIASGTGLNKWQKMASEQYVNNAVGATVSWREPALVRDNVATTLPTGTPTSPVIVDGVSITDGQRVLFSAIVGGSGKNVYVYNQATGTFTEDANQETSGDAVYVQSGTAAGKTYVFNGTAWVLTDQSSLDEEGFIRASVVISTLKSVQTLTLVTSLPLLTPSIRTSSRWILKSVQTFLLAITSPQQTLSTRTFKLLTRKSALNWLLVTSSLLVRQPTQQSPLSMLKSVLTL
jgi:hypothetical protein